VTDAVAGIFVGGRGERMGGAAKGLLVGPDGRPIVERLSGLLRGVGLDVVLIGADPRYDATRLPVIADERGGIGPLGGLVGLLRHAGDRMALAIACDMPFIEAALARRLLAAAPAPVVAPRRGAVWEPLFARYDARAVLPVARARAEAGHLSLQGLLNAVGAMELALDDPEWRTLRDWDSPADVRSGRED
jgi:molybdopterin-guanine dinucleotide biosynthesis protein A